jgi:outer membrane protein TolC
MKLWPVITAFLSGAVLVAAAETPARPISLQECLVSALQKNLELKIDTYNPHFALYNLQAARAAYEPTLSLSGQHSYTESSDPTVSGAINKTTADRVDSSLNGLTPWGMTYNLRANAAEQTQKSYFTNQPVIPFESSQGLAALDLTQPLLKNLWIDSTRLNIAVAKLQLKSSELGLKSAIMDIVTRVEVAYYNLEFGCENVKVQQKGLELAQRLLDENRKRVQVGALAPLDEAQSESQVAARQADVTAAEQNRDILENALKQLMTDNFAGVHADRLDPNDPLTPDRELFDLQDSWTKGLSLRPDYLQAKLSLEQAGVQLKFSRNQLYPELDLFGTLGYAGAGVEVNDAIDQVGRGSQPFYTVGGRITVPVGNGVARNQYKSSRESRDQSAVILKKTEQDIMIQIDNAIKLADSNFARLESTRKAREYAETALAAEEKKLENGKSTSFVVLSLQNDLTSARSNEISALVQYKISLAQLAQAEGTTLERHKIDINRK